MKVIRTKSFEKLAKSGPDYQGNMPVHRDYGRGSLTTLVGPAGGSGNDLDREELWGKKKKKKTKKRRSTDPLDRKMKDREGEVDLLPQHPL